jgi:hypothetical protein
MDIKPALRGLKSNAEIQTQTDQKQTTCLHWNPAQSCEQSVKRKT